MKELTVRELIELLRKENPDALVVIQQHPIIGDPRCSPLTRAWDGLYSDAGQGRGDAYIKDEIQNEIAEGFISEEDFKDCVEAVFLVPIN